MKREKLTVVFNVKGQKLDEFYDIFKNQGEILGMKPRAISWGDQLNVPSDIIDRLSNLDVDCLDTDELEELIEAANKHLIEEA